MCRLWSQKLGKLRQMRVADGATLWADTLDQQAADLFAIQDAISGKVTGALKLTLSSADEELLAKRYTNSAEAWQHCVKGRHLLHTRRISDTEKAVLIIVSAIRQKNVRQKNKNRHFSVSHFSVGWVFVAETTINAEKAITYFERALALDHGFALAYVLLGYSYASLSYFGYPAKEFMPKAKAAHEQALKLDDQLAEAHTHLALYQRYYEWDFNAAEQGHRRAIALNPNSADVRRGYAMSLTFMGRFDQAIPEIRRAEELDPTSPLISRNVAFALYLARRKPAEPPEVK